MFVKKHLTKSVNRVLGDLKQVELLPLKLAFFMQATTNSVLYPYFTIHMRQLGFTLEETAIISAVIPVIGIMVPPLTGMLADKIGNFRLLLAFLQFIGGPVALLMLLVPVGRVTLTYPESVLLNFGCSGLSPENIHVGHFNLSLSSDIPCDQVLGINASDSPVFDLDARLEGCGFVCRIESESKFQLEQTSKSEADSILNGWSYTIQIPAETGTNSYSYNLTKEGVQKIIRNEDILSHRFMANEDYLKKSIRRLAPSEYFFSATDVSHFNCQMNGTQTEEHISCILGAPEEMVPEVNSTIRFRLRVADGKIDQGQFQSEYLMWGSNEFIPATCKDWEVEGKGNISVVVFLQEPENDLKVVDNVSLSECRPRCLLSATRKDMCTNLKEDVVYDTQLTFWTYLFIRVFVSVSGSTAYVMYEVAVIAVLREQGGDYGLQRIYALIGSMISSPLSGILIDYFSQGKRYTNFKSAFYLYAGLKMTTSVFVLFINLEFKKAASKVVMNVIKTLKNPEIIGLLLACLVLGSAWGYIESFLFWFLEDIGGNKSLMGLTVTVGGVVGIPVLIFSGPIIKKIGHANVMVIGFFFYTIRLIGYSLIYNPYDCLYFEAMESITLSLTITAAFTYAAKLTTTTTEGSFQGMVGGLYFAVGRSSGSLIGGFLMKGFGTREAYRIFAGITIFTGIAYWLFNQFYIKKRQKTLVIQRVTETANSNENTEQTGVRQEELSSSVTTEEGERRH